jgi:exopolysaccharide biosynthesis polyprenyl glycosylphosphotransferase
MTPPRTEVHEKTPGDGTRATLAASDIALERLELPLRARRREAVARLALLAADAAVVAAGLLVAATLTDTNLRPWVIGLVPFFALLAKMARLYDRDQFVLHKTSLDEAPAMVAVAAIFTLLIEGFRALLFTGRSQPLVFCVTLTCALLAARGAVRFLTVRTTSTDRVLVIGDATAAATLRRKFANDPSLNAAVVGRVAMRADRAEPPDRPLGTIERLPGVLREHDIERVVVAPTREGGENIVEVIRLATACGVRVAVLPRLLEAIGTSVVFDDLGGQALLGVRGFGLSPSSRFMKRAFDVVIGTVLWVILGPLLLAIALAISLGSPGPVLFRQTRVGRHERKFEMLKFRTMVTDAEARKRGLLERNEAAPPLFKIADDPRTTRLGRFLRRYSLDELPQLLNVLRGDMSLVGPRPLIVEEDRLFSGWQRERHNVAPGVTGPWQILGSSRVPMSDMVTIDYLYCANWSLWLDAKILARTIPYVLSRRSGEHLPTRR